MSLSHAASRQAEIDRVGRGAGEGSLGDGIAIYSAATGASPPSGMAASCVRLACTEQPHRTFLTPPLFAEAGFGHTLPLWIDVRGWLRKVCPVRWPFEQITSGMF